MKENIQKALVIVLGLVTLVLITWLVFRENGEEEIDQVYLSEYLETEETIPTLDEVVERFGSNVTHYDVANAYSEPVGELFQQNLLPFEAELPTIEDSADLQAIERVYYSDVVDGVSPVKPNYLLTGEGNFEVNHQKPHVNVKSDALFVEEAGFQRVSDWLQAGYVQIHPHSDQVAVVEGLFKVSDRKKVSEILNLVNSLDIRVDETPAQPLLQVVGEESLLENQSDYVAQDDLYRYHEEELDSGDFVSAHQTFGYLEPALFSHVGQDLNQLKVIENTLLPFVAYLPAEDISDPNEVSLNNTTWALEESSESAVVID